jgi:DNA-directed RNA polymerase subunit RPC12/RpoP
MSTTVEYKCPSCGGGIQFDSGTQQMKCPYCDTTFKVEDVKRFNDALAEDHADDCQWEQYGAQESAGNWKAGETDGMKRYLCQSCGGEIVTDGTAAATSCPYCGNPVVLQDQLEGMWRPDMIIPFKLDKKAAKEALKKHLKGKHLLPNSFKTENHVDSLTGVYVPFWLFDAHTEGAARYRCTRVKHWGDAHYEYTRTDYYLVLRDGQVDFEKVPVDGATKMDDTMMEAIEPFDYSQAVDFETAYLSGYLADKYDVDAKASEPRANERIRTSTMDMLTASVDAYSSCVPEGCNIRIAGGKVHYALLPVWVLNTKYQGKMYPFAMNGQTGRFIGDLPMDKSKLLKYFLAIFAGVGTVVSVIACLL